MVDSSRLEWLIRDNTNMIRGPFKRHEVLQLLKKGQLKGKTEISQANAYWFAIEEKAELGIFFPELGGPKPEEPRTQMTGTLSHQAEPNDPKMDMTQFISAPEKKEITDSGQSSGSGEKGAPQPAKIEWLNEEFAEEFADAMDSFTLSIQTDVSQAGPISEPVALNEIGGEPTKESAADEKSTKEIREDLLKRATVKADTLPSEHKSFQGERPKPISEVLKGPDRPMGSGSAQPSNMVSVPVEGSGLQAKMLTQEEEEKAAEEARRRRKLIGVVVGALLGAGAIAAAISYLPPLLIDSNKTNESRPVRRVGTEREVRRALLLFDLEAAKESLSDLELEKSATGHSFIHLAQALVKREFLFDPEGALISLQTAKSLAKDAKGKAEVENLLANYGFDRDPAGAVEALRKTAHAFEEESVFRYNFALSEIRRGKPEEAVNTLNELVQILEKRNPLREDAAVALGWARDWVSYRNSLARPSDSSLKKGDPKAEAAYFAALETNPFSAKARLGLAIYRLKAHGLRSSESDFRAFIDALPELEPPARLLNFRKMNGFEFYNYARGQIRDLNVPEGPVGSKPSPLIMAVDGVLSILQSRTDEAEKILESGLSAAPGEPSLLKAVGYQRYKDGRYADLVDLLKDISRDRNSFGVNLLLGKAYMKLGKLDQAERHFSLLTSQHPNRSEGWSQQGELLLLRKKPEEAKKFFENALKRDRVDLAAIRGLDRLGEQVVDSPEADNNLPF